MHHIGLEKISRGSGLRLLKHLYDEVSASSAELGQWASKGIAAHIDAGITASTTVDFNKFRETYETLNAQLPPTRKHPESVRAEVYAAAARNLGDHLATRIHLRLETVPGAIGDLTKTIDTWTPDISCRSFFLNASSC